MRFDGTLKNWNAERGFGFITPRQGGQDVFVHISAFQRDGRTPREGEVLTFEVETAVDGKKRAARVLRPGQAAPALPSRQREGRAGRRGSGVGTTVLVLAIVAVIGWYAYGRYAQHAGVPVSGTQAPVRGSPAPQPAADFQCDGRTHCSQMTSCTEARFFLKNCPGVQMDGNNDGVPCEQQWCTSPLAR